MFIRTQRLFLRPPWPEDAAAVHEAIGHWEVVRSLGRAPWPYTLADAEAFVSRQASGPREANFLIWKRTDQDPVLVGCIGFGAWRGPVPEIGYWIAQDHWDCGYATEAGRAVLELAFEGLRLPKLAAGHFIDNPASGAVLRKLGFRATGHTLPCPCLARGCDVESVAYELTSPEWRMHAPLALAA